MTNKQLKNIKGAGRPAGSPNKSTAMAREAIAKFVDGNAHKMEKWLEQVAEGVPSMDKDGNFRYDSKGNIIWGVPPNPEKAFGMLQSVMEYHVPKLARTEIAGDKENPLTVQLVQF